MSDFLLRLAARSLSHISNVQPRLGSRFESPRASQAVTVADIEVEELLEPQAPAVPISAATPPAREPPIEPLRPLSSPAGEASRQPSAEPNVVVPAAPIANIRHVTQAPIPAPAATALTRLPDPPPASNSISPPPHSRELNRDTRHLQPARRASLRTEIHELGIVSQLPAADKYAAGHLPHKSSIEPIAQQAEPKAVAIVAQPHVSLPRAPSSSLPAGDLAPAPAPTVHVTIGRIEVRAVTSPAPAPSRPASKPAVTSLEEYLRERSGGRR